MPCNLIVSYIAVNVVFAAFNLDLVLVAHDCIERTLQKLICIVDVSLKPKQGLLLYRA